MNASENGSTIGIREGLQTPQYYPEGYTIRDFDLPPTCHMVVDWAVPFIKYDLPQDPTMLMELQNSRSGPTAAHLNHGLLEIGRENHVDHQIAQHTMMTVDDAALGFRIGPRLHLYGNASENGGRRRRSADELGDILEQIVAIAPHDQEVDIRASLEQATETDPKEIRRFIGRIADINSRFDRPIITGLGLPATNGGTPEQYESIFTMFLMKF
ncbi:hypothetical protein HYW55_03890 [Candidatus Gottesmanbacteria bacterium]|nr:hypothetical protein [Candidatus Gottesmanbacteria bacterium]